MSFDWTIFTRMTNDQRLFFFCRWWWDSIIYTVFDVIIFLISSMINWVLKWTHIGRPIIFIVYISVSLYRHFNHFLRLWVSLELNISLYRWLLRLKHWIDFCLGKVWIVTIMFIIIFCDWFSDCDRLWKMKHYSVILINVILLYWKF